MFDRVRLSRWDTLTTRSKTRAYTLSTDMAEYYILYVEREERFTRVVPLAKLSHAENSSVNNLESQRVFIFKVFKQLFFPKPLFRKEARSTIK